MQNNGKKALSICTVASLLIVTPAAGINVKAASNGTRLWGSDRYETSAKVSQNGWTSSDYAIVASGEAYPDALCAAPLAKANNAPILLTSQGSLNQATLDELKRLNVKHVYIVGGEGAVSAAVESQIKAVVSDTQRLAGQTRYETSIKVAEKLPASSKVVLASGENYADALSIAPVAAMEGMPIILTESKELSQAASDYIKSNSGITKTYVIGGSGAVSDSAVSGVPGAQRFGGSDRYETNKLVVEGFASDFSFGNAYVAIGNGPLGNEFADALSAAPLAAKNKNPLILTGQTLSDYTKALIKEKLTASSTLTVLGGTGVISDSLVADMTSAEGTSTAVSGGASGGSSGGSTNPSGYWNGDPKNPNSDVTLYGSNETLDSSTIRTSEIKGNLIITGDKTTVSGITVDGTIYINPGKEGNATLKGVTAKNIVVQSGANNSIVISDVKADTLTVDLSKSGDNDVHVESTGTTQITSTEVCSNATIDAQAGSFGTITIPQVSAASTVQFAGSFDRPIIVYKPLTVNVGTGANLGEFAIASGVDLSGVKLDGAGAIKKISVNSTTGTLTVPKDVTISDIQAVNNNNVDTSKNPNVPVDQYKDHTSSISDEFGKNINNYLDEHPNLKNYFSVTTEGSITIQLNDSNLNSLETAFNRTQAQDSKTIIDKLNKAQEQIDLYSAYMEFNDGTTVRDLFKELNSIYINDDGSLNVEKIAERIKDNTLTYAQFKQDVKDKVKAKYNTTITVPQLTFMYNKSYKTPVTSVVKDGKYVYNNTFSRAYEIDALLDLGDSTLGTYTIYSGKDYFTIKVAEPLKK